MTMKRFIAVVTSVVAGLLFVGAAPAQAKPVAGDVKVAVASENCGEVTFTFTNTTKYLFAATYDAGDGRQADIVIDGREGGDVDDTKSVTLTYPEDANGGSIEALLGVFKGAEQENYPATVEETVKTDCQPPTKVYAWLKTYDCTTDASAIVTLYLKVRSAEPKSVEYTTTKPSSGKLEAGGDPFKFEWVTKTLTFLEDAGDGEISVTYGRHTKTVKTDCEAPPTTETSAPETTTTVPPTSSSAEVPPPVSTTGESSAAPVTTTQPLVVRGVASEDDGGLAYTGASLLWPVGAVLLLLAGGGFALLYARRRATGDRPQSGSHRP